jgi:hypothetical protein
MSVFSTVIGTVTVTNEFPETQYGSRACDYTKHLVQPGAYEVTCEWERYTDGGTVFPKHVTVAYDTVIVESYAPNLFCGVPFGKNEPDTTHKPGHFHAHRYPYQFPAELAAGTREVEWLGGVFRPADGVQFEQHVFEGVAQRYVNSEIVYTEAPALAGQAR